ncbi:serine/threonine protein kinase [Polytolypa hystricis UAMH7299]|uniref:Serine/threonine protein kinase n=1 Tax=Polytolypa hystricis (strain UAMH7299) TaxID=1447883 RepID=A0A2B7XC55_POLH7|nr:serine/threonine protein kinase [Polytolypa hystricis UAMH7299]
MPDAKKPPSSKHAFLREIKKWLRPSTATPRPDQQDFGSGAAGNPEAADIGPENEKQTGSNDRRAPARGPVGSVAVSLPRPGTFKRQNSERRECLAPNETGVRRALSVDRRRPLSTQRTRSPGVLAKHRLSAPEVQYHDPELIVNLRARSREAPTLDSRAQTDATYSVDGDHEDDTIERELDKKWILNLSMLFRDQSEREKFFVTYAETPNHWRRVTVSCDYRNAEPDSLEQDLKQLCYQRDKSARIYESIRDSIPEIQFYDTVTNLRLETSEGRLHVHVSEDVYEIIPYPSVSTVAYLGCPFIRETDLNLEARLSGFAYLVNLNGKEYVKKEIPGQDSVGEFLYEINALHALQGSSCVIQLKGIVVDDHMTVVKGLLIEYADNGALMDMLFDFKGTLEWSRRERWARQIIQGLAEVHEAGFVQGDFTVSNIVVDRDDNAKIIDINRRGCPIGWDPPEFTQKLESKQRITMYIGVKSDLYQLGMSLWALAMEEDEPGRHPRPLFIPADVKVPDYYRNIVDICLSHRPQDRLSAKELLALFPSEESLEAENEEVVNIGQPSLDCTTLPPATTPLPQDIPQWSQRYVDHSADSIRYPGSAPSQDDPEYYPHRGRRPPARSPHHSESSPQSTTAHYYTDVPPCRGWDNDESSYVSAQSVNQMYSYRSDEIPPARSSVESTSLAEDTHVYSNNRSRLRTHTGSILDPHADEIELENVSGEALLATLQREPSYNPQVASHSLPEELTGVGSHPTFTLDSFSPHEDVQFPPIGVTFPPELAHSPYHPEGQQTRLGASGVELSQPTEAQEQSSFEEQVPPSLEPVDLLTTNLPINPAFRAPPEPNTFEDTPSPASNVLPHDILLGHTVPRQSDLMEDLDLLTSQLPINPAFHGPPEITSKPAFFGDLDVGQVFDLLTSGLPINPAFWEHCEVQVQVSSERGIPTNSNAEQAFDILTSSLPINPVFREPCEVQLQLQVPSEPVVPRAPNTDQKFDLLTSSLPINPAFREHCEVELPSEPILVKNTGACQTPGLLTSKSPISPDFHQLCEVQEVLSEPANPRSSEAGQTPDLLSSNLPINPAFRENCEVVYSEPVISRDSDGDQTFDLLTSNLPIYPAFHGFCEVQLPSEPVLPMDSDADKAFDLLTSDLPINPAFKDPEDLALPRETTCTSNVSPTAPGNAMDIMENTARTKTWDLLESRLPINPASKDCLDPVPRFELSIY